MEILIRREEKKDYEEVEFLTREAFWNLYVPGADEHYLAHILRTSPDFIPELDLVAVIGDKLVGNIMFTKSYVLSDDGTKHDTITFGPLSVLPDYQKQGVGKALIESAKNIALDMGYKAILIHGFPSYYNKQGFKAAKEFGISNSEGLYPAAHLAQELYKGALDGITGKAFETQTFFSITKDKVDEFDKKFPPKKKEATPSQAKFNEMASLYL